LASYLNSKVRTEVYHYITEDTKETVPILSQYNVILWKTNLSPGLNFGNQFSTTTIILQKYKNDKLPRNANLTKFSAEGPAKIV